MGSGEKILDESEYRLEQRQQLSSVLLDLQEALVANVNNMNKLKAVLERLEDKAQEPS